jgi:hypothetical protein
LEVSRNPAKIGETRSCSDLTNLFNLEHRETIPSQSSATSNRASVRFIFSV